jgi:hypothetical protein
MDNFSMCYHRTQRGSSIDHAWYYINTSAFNGIHFHLYERETGVIVGGLELHSSKPLYEGSSPIMHCFVTGFKPCYCDGSASQGVHLFEMFDNDLPGMIKQHDKVFSVLKNIYEERF